MSSPQQPPAFFSTRSAHNVLLWIRQGIAEGRLKKCWNLDIQKIGKRKEEKGEMVDTGESYFIPVCRHQSFESIFSHMNDEIQLVMLEQNLHTNPVSCPKNCTYYENRKRAWVRFTIGRIFRGFFNGARELLKGFAGLTWQTQVAIIVFLVLVVSPKWAPILISLAKAIWGKTP
jgi:hypothetical protein